MGKFADAFRGDFLIEGHNFTPSDYWAAPGEWQQYVSEHFADYVAETNLYHWNHGDEITSRGKRILIGVASYSRREMQLLDVLDNWLEEHKPTHVRIDVFDIGVYKEGDLEKSFPDARSIWQTPVTGFWESGVFQEMVVGYNTREFLAKHLGIPLHVLQLK